MESNMATATFSTEKRPNLSSIMAIAMADQLHVSKALDSLAVPIMAASPHSINDDGRVPALSDFGQEDRSLFSPENHAVPEHEPELIIEAPNGSTSPAESSNGSERLVPSFDLAHSSTSTELSVLEPSRLSPVQGAGAFPAASSSSTRRMQRKSPAVRAPVSSAHGLTFAISMTVGPRALPTSRNYIHQLDDSDDEATATSQPSSSKASSKRRARAQKSANYYEDWSDSEEGDASLDEFLPHQPSAKRAHTSPAQRSRKQKQCACCNTTSTPLWRDVRPNLPLCNACGIRFKKYGKICDTCHYVPCKSERDSKVCNRCGDKLPPASKPKVVRK